MVVVESKKSNLYWWSFRDEFTKKSYNGKTFNTMVEAVNYANDAIVYNNQQFDLISINSPSYEVVDSMDIN